MRGLTLAWLLLLPLRATAGDLTVTIKVPSATATAPVKVRLLAQSVDVTRESRQFDSGPPATSLPSGDWFLSSLDSRFWSNPQLVTVTDTPQAASLTLYPLARLIAAVTVPSGRMPKGIDVWFRRVEAAGADSPSEGHVVCPLRIAMAACELPAGRFDLAFRLPGNVSRYRWDIPLSPAGPVDVGALHFVRGSTVSGQVLAGSNRKVPLDQVSVSLRPALSPGANEALQQRNSVAALSVHPNRKGFFAFDVAGGEYLVQASHRDWISEERRIEVSEGREAVLRHPLLLEAPRKLTVRITPPLNPWSNPWTVLLTRIDPAGVVLSERWLKTTPDGTCVFDRELPGLHRMLVARSQDESWMSTTFELDRSRVLDTDVQAIRVHGVIRLGSAPLAAKATLHSNQSGARVTVRSGTDGRFVALLPPAPDGRWDEVELDASNPPVRRAIRDVTVLGQESGSAELNFLLPSRSITGFVVDESGQPAGPALVDVHSQDRSVQQVETLDGSFQVHALEPGTYSLVAHTRHLESREPVLVGLPDEMDATKDATIVVSPILHLHGMVRSSMNPVVGAAIFAEPAGLSTHQPLIPLPSDPEGRFDIRLPSGTSDALLAINAPGFAFRIGLVPVRNEEQAFGVDQNGGVLTIDAAATREGRRPFIVHNDAIILAAGFAYLSGAAYSDLQGESQRFSATVEPGAYALCWLHDGNLESIAASSCVSGTMTPHGELTLKARE